MAENEVLIKSKDFAVRIVNLYKFLTEEKKEYVLSKQLLRSGTSIGANICEAECSVTHKDFISKMYVSFKECSETLYWLELLVKTEFLTTEQYESINGDCTEIFKLLSSITKTAKENERKEKYDK